MYLLIFSLSNVSQQPLQRSERDMSNFCLSARIKLQYTTCTELANHFPNIRMYTFSAYTIIYIPESGQCCLNSHIIHLPPPPSVLTWLFPPHPVCELILFQLSNGMFSVIPCIGTVLIKNSLFPLFLCP